MDILSGDRIRVVIDVGRDQWDGSSDQTNSEVLGMGVLMETG